MKVCLELQEKLIKRRLSLELCPRRPQAHEERNLHNLLTFTWNQYVRDFLGEK